MRELRKRPTILVKVDWPMACSGGRRGANIMHRTAAFVFALVLSGCQEMHANMPESGDDPGANPISNQASASTVASDAKESPDTEHVCWTHRLTVGQSTKDDVGKIAGRPHETSVWKGGKGKCVELWYWGDSGGGLGPAVYFDAQGVVCMISAEARD